MSYFFIVVSFLIGVSFGFKDRTCALAGFHPRFVGLLLDSALAELILIFDISEALGELPPQLEMTQINLLIKPQGGRRPIGWYQSLFRIWSRVRMPEVKAWEISCASMQCFAAERNLCILQASITLVHAWD